MRRRYQMMDCTKFCSVLLVTVFLVLQKADLGSGIRCYFCAMRGCRDDFDFNSAYVNIHDCQSGQCTKNKAADGSVVRSCLPTRQVSDGCQEMGDVMANCACSTDLCNAAPKTMVSIATIVMTTMGLIVGKALL